MLNDILGLELLELFASSAVRFLNTNTNLPSQMVNPSYFADHSLCPGFKSLPADWESYNSFRDFPHFLQEK
jgi:hypothetical protein